MGGLAILFVARGKFWKSVKGARGVLVIFFSDPFEIGEKSCERILWNRWVWVVPVTTSMSAFHLNYHQTLLCTGHPSDLLSGWLGSTGGRDLLFTRQMLYHWAIEPCVQWSGKVMSCVAYTLLFHRLKNSRRYNNECTAFVVHIVFLRRMGLFRKRTLNPIHREIFLALMMRSSSYVRVRQNLWHMTKKKYSVQHQKKQTKYSVHHILCFFTNLFRQNII